MNNKYLIYILIVLFSLPDTGLVIHAKTHYLERDVPIAQQMIEPNVSYVIKYDFDLNGNVLMIPDGCTLIFKSSGKLSHGELKGNNTDLKGQTVGCLSDCKISGVWNIDVAKSSFFDKSLDARQLFLNLTAMSKKIALISKRQYTLDNNEEKYEISEIKSEDNGIPEIHFHINNPNKIGIIFLSDTLHLSGIKFSSDFGANKDKIIDNNITLGSLVYSLPQSSETSVVYVENCHFSGGTPSSYFSSSKVGECYICKSSFEGYMADHAVYCSMKVRSYSITDCIVSNARTTGLFKVRDSMDLRSFQIKGLKVNNIDGYLVNLTLVNSQDADIVLSNISVTNSEASCYAFNVASENNSTHNAKSLLVEDCKLSGGTHRNIFNAGANQPSYIKDIEINNVDCSGFGISGLKADTFKVKNSSFIDNKWNRSSLIQSKDFCIMNSNIAFRNNGATISKLFLVDENVESITIDNSKLDVEATYLLEYYKYKHPIKVSIHKTTIDGLGRGVVRLGHNQNAEIRRN